MCTYSSNSTLYVWCAMFVKQKIKSTFYEEEIWKGYHALLVNVTGSFWGAGRDSDGRGRFTSHRGRGRVQQLPPAQEGFRPMLPHTSGGFRPIFNPYNDSSGPTIGTVRGCVLVLATIQEIQAMSNRKFFNLKYHTACLKNAITASKDSQTVYYCKKYDKQTVYNPQK